MPDMRTKLAPGCAASQASTSRSAAPARSPAPRGRCAPRASRRAGRDRSPSQRREHLAGRQRDARDSPAAPAFRQIRQRRPSVQLVARPFAPRGHAEQAGRDVAAERRRDRRGMRRVDAPQATSAAAAPPPHRPSRRRCPTRPASSCRGAVAAPAAIPAASRSARAASSTRLSSIAPSSPANGPDTSQRQARPPARRSAGRRRCRRRRASRSHAARRAACRGRAAQG